VELGHLELLGPAKWTYFYLYAILDVFSRYCVGWTVQHREAASVAEALIAQAAEQQQITRGQLTVHADRGSSMTSKPVALLLADLGVTKTHSRPYTSTDNPYSEAQFKPLKYRPEFPERFENIEQARAFCRAFFDWYNHQHRHSGIGLMTPAAVHDGHAEQLRAKRARVLADAYARNPERFVRRPPEPPALPTATWINQARHEGGGSLNSNADRLIRLDRLRTALLHRGTSGSACYQAKGAAHWPVPPGAAAVPG
jgi:putative transposase